MSTTTNITLEQVEALAAELTGAEQERRAKLVRLIAAYARILAVREPEAFPRRATRYGDEAGHYDSSFPPDQVYSERTGPRLLRIVGRKTEDTPTSGGFYHQWRRVTVDPGLYVDRHGTLWGSDEHGTGELGAFAAHPGYCGVDCEIDWEPIDVDDDVPIDRLEKAELALRQRAFPRATAAEVTQ